MIRYRWRLLTLWSPWTLSTNSSSPFKRLIWLKHELWVQGSCLPNSNLSREKFCLLFGWRLKTNHFNHPFISLHLNIITWVSWFSDGFKDVWMLSSEVVSPVLFLDLLSSSVSFKFQTSDWPWSESCTDYQWSSLPVQDVHWFAEE